MRKPSALTVMLFLLVLLPSGVLAWLGLRSADAFDATELSRLRGEAKDEAERLAGGPLADTFGAEIQGLIDRHARDLADALPGLGIGWQMRQTRSRIFNPGLEVAELRLINASGRTIYPVTYQPEDRAGGTGGVSRAGLIGHLRRKADRAYYGEGGEDAAVAVWDDAMSAAQNESLRTLFDVEKARVRARKGWTAALRESQRLDEAWSEAALVRVGRPVILLWASAVAIPADSGWSFIGGNKGLDGRYRERLGRLALAGLINATPFTAEERLRMGRGDPVVEGDRPPTVEFSAVMPGGARLVVRVTRGSVLRLLMARLSGRPWGNPERTLWIEGLSGDAASLEAFQEHGTWRGREGEYRAAAQDHADVRLPDGTVVRVHLSMTTWRWYYERGQERRNQTIAGIVILLLVTTLGLFLIRRAVSREREARRVRDDFIANVTHEVRTPLTSVLLHAEMLLDEEGDPAKRKEHAEVVQAQGKRLAALVGDMLDFSALQSGKRTLEVSPIDLAAACQEAIAPYRVLAEREGASVVFTEPDGEAVAMADPAALARILANLVGNAWKHGRPSSDGHPGRLRMLAREDAGGGVIEVRDDGPGIPLEERGRVFERFGRGRAAIAKEGSGIGLSLARDLARAMGGDLDVLEDAPETVFRLRLAPVPDLDLE